MNFDQNEESLNNQSNEDFVNEKRFKYSPDAFEIIASSPDSFGKKQLSNQKNFENEQQRQDFSSFKNLDDYPVDNETFEKDDLFEEETFVFQINGFKKNDKKTFQKLSFMENKVRGNLNNQPKEYYQNCSFRPSWCCDGFCSLGGNKYGNYSIDVNKVIIYQEFFQKTENCTNDYENYRNITNEYNKNLTILFKVISESCDIGSVEKNIENLSFVEKKENNYAWPSKQQFLQKIFLYMNKYCKTLNFKKDYLFKQKFYQDELFNIGLMNILFGNAKIDIIRFFKMIQNNTTTDQKLFNHLYENIEKFQRDNRKDDYFRKILLNKYLEAKSYKVLKNCN